uniref:Apolipoprotein A5 n=1 Tax=Buteo japonicus TaxID=224669 RepID=A0A8C0B7C7_9AVES
WSWARPSWLSTAFIMGALGHSGGAVLCQGCSVTTPAVLCRNLKESVQDGVSYMGNFLEKLAPLNRGLQPRLYHDSDSLRKVIRKELESLRVKLSPYVDDVHQTVGKHLEDLRYRLQPFTEELLDQVALKARELRRHLTPSRERFMASPEHGGTPSSVPSSGAGPTPATGQRGAALHLWPLTSWSCLSNKVFSVPFEKQRFLFGSYRLKPQ